MEGRMENIKQIDDTPSDGGSEQKTNRLGEHGYKCQRPSREHKQHSGI